MKFVGIGLVILAAVCWGISGGIANILMNKGWSPTVISFYRGAVGLIVFCVWLLFRLRKNWIMPTRFYMWSLLAGIGVAGNFTLYFLSIQASSITVAATLMYTAPVFVLLISFLLGIERSTWFKWGCISLVLIGIVLLTGAYNIESISVSFLGTTTGLASGLSYALFIFGFKKATSMGKPETALTMAFFSFCFILFIIMDKKEALRVMTSSELGWFLLLGIIGGGLSFMFYVNGLQRIAPTTASLVAMIEPVTASLFGVLLLGNRLNGIQSLGMGLILITITILSVKQKSRGPIH